MVAVMMTITVPLATTAAGLSTSFPGHPRVSDLGFVKMMMMMMMMMITINIDVLVDNYSLACRLAEWVAFLHAVVIATVVMCLVRNPACTARERPRVGALYKW